MMLRVVSCELRVLMMFGIVVFMMANVFAFGVSPGRTTLGFESGLSKTVSFEIINSEGKDMDFILSVDGDLSDYINVSQRKVSIGASESKKVISYDISLPDSLEPGTRTGRIIVTEIPKESGSALSYVSGTLAVATQLHVNVPFPGKYASASLVVYNVAEGDDIIFVFPIFSKGKFNLSEVRANIDVYNNLNERIGSFNTDSIAIPSGEKKELVYRWENDLPVGSYFVKATLIYDEGTSPLEASFNVGSKELELQEIKVNDFSLGQIVKLEMLVENKWSELVKDAFIETKIMDDGEEVVASFRSSAYDIDPLKKTVFTSYWDTAGVAPGSYVAEVIINYIGKESKKNLKFEEIGRAHV